ncbi:MAG: glycerol-3-phosphate acyltransferase, partial [Alkaliphilus sp.]|nr:glycerol-3-phosphate acyltransferase [Alkaliphilus sp.]
YPLGALICILVGILVVIKTKYISLGSLVAICLLPILLIFSGIKLFLFGVSMAAMAIIRHRTNIKRLMEGTESKLSKKTGIK